MTENEIPAEVSIVLPTYEEAENLPIIIPEICRVLLQASIRGEVIVVDDDSPDGTCSVAEKLAEDYPVKVISRKQERGLASAVLAGFKASQAKVCVVMDADGSHPVEKLPEIIGPLLSDQADVTVGSRNVKGGSSANWPWYRRLISRTAGILSAGLSKMTDPTSGFMGIRRELLAGLKLDPIGWKVVLEIVVKAAPSRLIEIPITFRDRHLGRSKMSIKAQLSYIRHLYHLHKFKHQTLIEFIKFCIVGFSGILVDMGMVIALKELFALDTRICAIGGFSLAVTTNYLLNRFWSFTRGRETPFLKSYLIFCAVCGVGLAVRLGTMHLLIEYTYLDTGYGYLLTNFIGIVVATAVNFAGSKAFAFSPEKLAFRSPKEESRTND
ncbi:MAG: glycosyltransferase family 2 protein [Deltaproteobacteria bacterium]|nr:glycosyltransferase family 2 protein [Deltaproteobacteria bacterium]